MKKCKNCKADLAYDDIFCPQCGKDVSNKEIVMLKSLTKKAITFIKRNKKVFLVVIIAIAIAATAIIIYNETHCRKEHCNNTVASGYNYCYNHKCAFTGCSSPQASSYNTNYCHYHHLLYSESTQKNALTDLEISNLRLTNNSSYTKVTGTITNEGTVSYSYVKVKGSFKTYSGTVVDTDWTYAVGSEGLSPGESKTFTMSVPKDYSIDDCSITIIDYD